MADTLLGSTPVSVLGEVALAPEGDKTNLIRVRELTGSGGEVDFYGATLGVAVDVRQVRTVCGVEHEGPGLTIRVETWLAAIALLPSDLEDECPPAVLGEVAFTAPKAEGRCPVERVPDAWAGDGSLWVDAPAPDLSFVARVTGALTRVPEEVPTYSGQFTIRVFSRPVAGGDESAGDGLTLSLAEWASVAALLPS